VLSSDSEVMTVLTSAVVSLLRFLWKCKDIRVKLTALFMNCI
jgi:hypothetical protein